MRKLDLNCLLNYYAFSSPYILLKVLQDDFAKSNIVIQYWEPSVTPEVRPDDINPEVRPDDINPECASAYLVLKLLGSDHYFKLAPYSAYHCSGENIMRVTAASNAPIHFKYWEWKVHNPNHYLG